MKTTSKKTAHWAIKGLGWGAAMFILTEFIMPWVKEEPITLRHVLIGVPIWVVGGLAFGRFDQWIGKRHTPEDPDNGSIRN